jgi:hypothetical protein
MQNLGNKSKGAIISRKNIKNWSRNYLNKKRRLIHGVTIPKEKNYYQKIGHCKKDFKN